MERPTDLVVLPALDREVTKKIPPGCPTEDPYPHHTTRYFLLQTFELVETNNFKNQKTDMLVSLLLGKYSKKTHDVLTLSLTSLSFLMFTLTVRTSFVGMREGGKGRQILKRYLICSLAALSFTVEE